MCQLPSLLPTLVAAGMTSRSADEQFQAIALGLAALLLCSFSAGSRLWAQGPPYQTDDPVPVDLHHYEFYIFGSTDSTPVVATSGGPAFEFNWGAVPRVQIHAVLPFGESAPSNSAGLRNHPARGRAPLG